MHYRASLGTTAKIITLVILALLAFIGYRNWLIFEVPVWLKIITTILFLAIIILGWLYAPRNYSLSDNALIINRPINNVSISLNEITDVRTITKAELGTLIRLWGSGGFFGYYGKFRSTRMGRMILYTTSRSNLILLVTDSGDQILLSPDDMSFIDAFKLKLTGRKETLNINSI